MFMRDVSHAADPEPVPVESCTKTLCLSLTFAAGGKGGGSDDVWGWLGEEGTRMSKKKK